MKNSFIGLIVLIACSALYGLQKNELLEIQSDGSAAGKPDPVKARMDLIEKAVTSGNLHQLSMNQF